MTIATRSVLLLTTFLSPLLTASAPAQDSIPWLDPSAREIVEKVDRFYRALPNISCTAEVEVVLGEVLVRLLADSILYEQREY